MKTIFDGNGRLARLLVNIPIINAGLPPLIISREHRFTYINLLGKYTLENKATQINNQHMLPTSSLLADFKAFLKQEWQQSMDIVEQIKQQQSKRNTR